MKLNADILYERLKEYYPVEMYGSGSRKLTLLFPELYIDNTERFLENHVYLATVEHLPRRPTIGKNVVLICIGDGSVLNYYKEHAVILLIRKKVDFFEVYQTVQRIFELFSRWESEALALFLGTPTVEEILKPAVPVLGGPIFVLDGSFQLVSSVSGSGDRGEPTFPSVRGALDPEAFLSYLREKDMNMDIHGAFTMEMQENTVLCVNLFSPEDEYIGCLFINQTDRSYTQGELALAEKLALMVEKVCIINPVLINHEKSTLREILRLTMNEKPLQRSQKLLLHSANNTRAYRCVSVHYTKPFSTLPTGYICSVFEGIFSDSVFFEYHNTLFGLIPEDALSTEGKLAGSDRQRLEAMLRDMQLCMGVSNDFQDLYMLRTYYFQAESAIENGHLLGEGKFIFHFADYALTEMITNSLGGLPAEVFFPKGMRELIDHDKTGGISYLDTLRVLLEDNMSLTRAARRLYIHRSSLVERIARIEKELSIDLNDPDQRMQLQILFKAMAIENQARSKM